MRRISIKARAKINVGLDVLSKRPDGYHEMRMIMQTVALHDSLLIKEIERKTLKIVCNHNWLPVDSRNLVHRAASFLIEEYKIKNGVFIDLQKNIPLAAGLAGGSADCAATLLGMRNLFQLPIGDNELMSIGKSFGADVPYCIMGGTALAEGIGENLKPLSPHPHAFVLLAKPAVGVSTASVFKALNLNAVTNRPDIDKLISDIDQKNLPAIASGMCNVLESVTSVSYPIIKDIEEIMLKNGALGAIMSGSGPTVFGYFRKKNHMQRAVNALKINLPELREIHQSYIFNP